MKPDGRIRLMYGITYGGNGKDNTVGEVKVSRSNGNPLVCYRVNGYQAPITASFGEPFVFLEDDLPVITSSFNAQWRGKLIDPEDEYRTLQIWGENGEQHSLPLMRPPSMKGSQHIKGSDDAV